MCVYDQNYSLVILTQPKMKMCKMFRLEESVLISHSTLQNHFCLGLSSFQEINFYINTGVLLCVYDQNYPLVIVTQPKKDEGEISLYRRAEFSFII